jgi:hypothetical protein
MGKYVNVIKLRNILFTTVKEPDKIQFFKSTKTKLWYECKHKDH